jgi:Cu-Zn family superoxide dismutase
METIYQKKYFKYKSKYNNLKNNDNNENINIIGGENNISNKPIKAIALFSNSEIKGTVRFEEIFDLNGDYFVLVNVDLEGFVPNTIHGFHVHESGDLTKGCASMCAHFNPFNKNHGGRDDEERHVGDLGNLEADSEGKVKLQFEDKIIKLRGDISNIIGRGLIVHEDPDDCGKGIFEDSKTTGHSGKRIACAIIGYASNCKS